jgi:hypothetical protein
MVTQGLAKTVNENLFKCEVPLRNYRISAVGTITADDGTVLAVPANTAYQTGPKLRDLFNECNKTTPAKLTDVKPENVPIVEIDPDGEVITGYIVADNYFELYVNGKLIGVDPIPFTPFNSVIVRFKALPLSSRPPGPTAMTSPSCGFSFAVSGMMMPPLLFSSASIRLMTTRS